MEKPLIWVEGWGIDFSQKNYIWNQTLQEISGYCASANYLDFPHKS